MRTLKPVPDVCDRVWYQMRWDDKPRSWRVTSWLKPLRVFTVTPEGEASLPDRWADVDLPEHAKRMLAEVHAQFPPRAVGTHNLPLVNCSREEAYFVSIVEACGMIVHVNEVEIHGSLEGIWSPELIESARHSAQVMIGEAVR